MGEIRKVGDVYYIEFYARGLLYSQIAGPDLAAAQKLLEKTEATIAKGEALTVVREIDLVVFWQQFLGDIQKQCPSGTIRRFKSTIDHFNDFLKADHPNVSRLSQVTPSVVEAYKATLIKQYKTRPKVINLTLLLLREVVEYGIKISFINDNPTLHVRLLPMPSPKRKATARWQMVVDFFNRRVGFCKIAEVLKLPDIARMMYFSELIPLSREDIYT